MASGRVRSGLFMSGKSRAEQSGAGGVGNYLIDSVVTERERERDEYNAPGMKPPHRNITIVSVCGCLLSYFLFLFLFSYFSPEFITDATVTHGRILPAVIYRWVSNMLRVHQIIISPEKSQKENKEDEENVNQVVVYYSMVVVVVVARVEHAVCRPERSRKVASTTTTTPDAGDILFPALDGLLLRFWRSSSSSFSLV